PLAELILRQPHGQDSPNALALPFLGPEVATVEDALAGARDIVAEAISDAPDVRRVARQRARQFATLRCARIEKADDPRGVYQTYYDFAAPVGRLKPFQTLAINRGEAAKVLRVKLDVPERDWQDAVGQVFRPDVRSPLAEHLSMAIADAAARLL